MVTQSQERIRDTQRTSLTAFATSANDPPRSPDTSSVNEFPQKCGAFVELDSAGYWCVWAPFARTVELLLDGVRVSRMHSQPGGYFTHSEPTHEGQRYAFCLDGGPFRPDPASRWQPDGVHRSSAVWCPQQFQWTDDDWSGLRREQLAIYELHVGTFTPEGTFDAVVPRLDQLRDLGVTAIELMPVAQFPCARNWGYDGVHPFAVQNSYGGPHGLQRLVNEAHRADLGIILDVVYNHLGPEGNYLAEFGPYFTDRYRTPWGQVFNFDGRGSDVVRAFVLQNVRQWIREFHVDGLRLDAVHAVFDCSPRHILGEIQDAALAESYDLGRPVHVIAESELNDVRLLNRPQVGGYALDAQWCDDFHHAVHSLLTGERHGYYADFGRAEQLVKSLNQAFVYDGLFSDYYGRRQGAPIGDHGGDRFVVCIQNHDQVGNRPHGDRFGTLLRPAQQRLAAGLLLLAPYIPLVFMGEEFGETHPFPYFCSFDDAQLIEAVQRGRRDQFADFTPPVEPPDPQSIATFESARLSWTWPEGTWQSGLRHLYRDLLHARRSWPALQDFRNRSASLIGTHLGADARVLRLTRGSEQTGIRPLICFFNLSAEEQPLANDDVTGCSLLLSSEWIQYAAESQVRSEGDSSATLAPFEFCVFDHDSRRFSS
jgi:maltooligosyltrehalose trehalohydrolase